MTYWYILAGIWTFLAIVWTSAIFSTDAKTNISKAERFVRAKEELAEAYKDHAS